MMHFWILCIRIARGNGLWEVWQVIHAGDENVLNTVVLKVIQDTEPELRGLVLADPHAQHVFVALQIDANDHISSLNGKYINS